MRRREFVTLLGSAAAFRPLAVRAQQKVPMRHIGILLYAKQEKATIDPVLRGLEQLGYTDGKNVIIEYRDADGQYDRLQEAADDLVRLKPNVIFSLGASRLRL
jgi:putative ABC transport system substrate-binding protein